MELHVISEATQTQYTVTKTGWPEHNDANTNQADAQIINFNTQICYFDQ